MLPIAIFLIMLGIGTGLRLENFTAIFRKPKSILVGLGGQMLYLPALAFLLAFIWPIDPVYKVGLIILAACPGGTASNLITYILNAKVALSVSLTALNSILILMTVPFFVGLAQSTFMRDFQPVEMPFWHTVEEIALTVLLPVGIGVLLNHLFPLLMERIQKPLKYIMTSILLVVFLGVFIASENGDTDSIFEQPLVFLAAFLLNLGAFVGGVFISNYFGLTSKEKVTVGIEVGLQNSALAIFVAASLLGSNEMALVAVMYSLFTFFTTFIYAWISLYWIRWKGVAGKFKL
ncbi:MAG: bile acid:sodium symporter family protein [Saprospirales bacterium]|nr:MAG: bile acid:sodium symporter family protein [Saprospirales bacterium]